MKENKLFNPPAIEKRLVEGRVGGVQWGEGEVGDICIYKALCDNTSRLNLLDLNSGL